MNRTNELMTLFKSPKQNKDKIFYKLVEVKRSLPTDDKMKQNTINTVLTWALNIQE